MLLLMVHWYNLLFKNKNNSNFYVCTTIKKSTDLNDLVEVVWIDVVVDIPYNRLVNLNPVTVFTITTTKYYTDLNNPKDNVRVDFVVDNPYNLLANNNNNNIKISMLRNYIHWPEWYSGHCLIWHCYWWHTQQLPHPQQK